VADGSACLALSIHNATTGSLGLTFAIYIQVAAPFVRCRVHRKIDSIGKAKWNRLDGPDNIGRSGSRFSESDLPEAIVEVEYVKWPPLAAE
jgi:hypothetical protein